MTEDIIDKPEKRVYPGKMAAQDYKIKLAEEKIEWAQKVMLILAFFALVKLIFLLLSDTIFDNIIIDVIIQSIIVIVYVVCSFLTKKSPTIAIGIVLVFYIGIQALLTNIHGFGYLHTGITFKVALLSFIIYGLYFSIKVKSMRTKLEEDYTKHMFNLLKK